MSQPRPEGACLIRGDAGRTVRHVLDRIGDRWSLLVVATLHGDGLRFTELLRRVPGVSQRMLTLTLRHLERDGLVARTSYPEVPPRVEYELTETGRTLIGPAVALAEWAAEHNPDIERSRRSYDAARDAGADSDADTGADEGAGKGPA
ncbi:winged helix-turn-helix transcriptional regulator [Streptomyces mangrovisoli]|uniref:winged helix-turn-helix transcriptional regulator n=1 Tax=Streptomyces mangrovisoli TaxID=1428628 RepID=UPI0009A11071|nr:helix-turn-helix domain-containing protein [Streptomyces mangrovisoli]